MHDNTLARALARRGIDILLIPTYTPIRTDEENVSIDRIFLGGVNVYLEQVLPGYRFMAPLLGPLLDQPWILRLATRRASATSARSLARLTVSMLRGSEGRQRREIAQLCRWLESSLRPQLVVFSNVMIAACVPDLKRRLDVPVLVTLQGDDLFLESLPDPYREQALREIRRLLPYVDGFLVHSRFYADFMADYLQIPPARIRQIPLGIDVSGFASSEPRPARASHRPTVGYLARLAPEKGLHLLVDAFLELHRRGIDCRLRMAGYLGGSQRAYAEEQFARLRAAGLTASFEYAGSLDRQQKIEFLRSLDVLSVPTTYREPKGLYVLEALAAGVPVVQPSHGAFPELLERLQGGFLVRPNDAVALADGLARLLADDESRRRHGEQGRARVLEEFHADAMAEATWQTWQEFLPG
jgi:glycosyltransferase involved in cell wall biosynthesis